MTDKPHFTHDCTACVFLGSTIAGGRHTDLYAHPSTHHGDISRDATIIARYGSGDGEYYSTIAKEARPTGHAELFAGVALWRQLKGY